jgi:hypothetical protein
MEDLEHYLKMFERGEFEKFPKVKVEWSKKWFYAWIDIH